MRKLIRPIRVYLDHAIWINFSQGKGAPKEFIRLVDVGILVPIFSTVHLIETNVADAKFPQWKPGHELARWLDAVFQSRREKIMWARNFIRIRHEEIVREAHRCMRDGRTLPEIEPVAGRLYEVLGDESADRNRAIESLTFVEMLEIALSNPQTRKALDAWVGMRAQSPRDLIESRANRNTHGKPRFDRKEIIEKWVVPELISTPNLNPGLVRRRFGVSRCPLLRAHLAYHMGRNLSISKGYESDPEDYAHLGGVMYADVAFADYQTVRALREGGLPTRLLPKRNVEFDAFLERVSSRCRL